MKELVKMGMGYSIGTMAMAKVGKSAPPQVMSNVYTAMNIGSLSMPIHATKQVTKQMKWL